MDDKTNMLQQKVWAVVGATSNKEKYGYKIFKCIHDMGLEVYPVNPGVTEIMGEKCYPSLKDLPVKPGAVNIVVPPTVTLQVLRDCEKLGIKNVWLQPGAQSQEVLTVAAQYGLNVVHHACIMVELKKQGGFKQCQPS